MNNNVAVTMLGNADLSNGVMHSTTPNKDRLLEELESGAIIRGFCTNCGVYPEFPSESAGKLAEVGGFDLPPHNELRKFYIEVNSCANCNKKIAPQATLKTV